ncbi:MAG: transposase [Methylococcaceae bacterium]
MISGFERRVSRDVGVAPTLSVGATPTSRLKKHKKPNPHSKDLRKGRHSEPNQIYHITTITEDRNPVFKNFRMARNLILLLKNEQQLGRASTLAFVVMPDHLHWLMQLTGKADLSQIIQSVKTLSAKQFGQPFWAVGFYDHALRKEEDILAIARYIVANPLRAGLVKRIGDYPHWDAQWLQ